jgi:hypothetical protein
MPQWCRIWPNHNRRVEALPDATALRLGPPLDFSSIRTRRFEAVEGLKDIFQLLRCHADPGIVNLDADVRTVATASQKNLPALFREFHGVARDVAHDAS